MPSQSLVKHRPPPPVYGTLLNNFPSYHHHIIPSSPPPPTPATDNDCAICLTPLHSHATLHLQCGHTWHLHCIREQIMRSQPTVSKPLTFSGIRCPICMQICRHQLIDKLVAPCEALLKKVACVALEQMTIDQTSLLLTSKGGHQVVELQQQQQQHRRQIITIDTNHISAEDQMLVDAYTFYMCAKCEQPYIAGISDCLDQYQNNNNNTNNNSNNNNNDNNSNTTTATTTIINNNNDIISVCDSSSISNLCTTCLLTSSPTSNPFSFAKPLGELCRSPHTHTPFFVWKCRFCCQPASVLCHNHTHLCKSCYERDTAVRNGMALKFPPKRCKGHGVCMNVHMEQNEYMHRNGPTIDCELLLYCAICESLPKCSGTSNSKGSGMKGHVGRSGNNNSRQNGRLVRDERRDGGGGGGETNQQKCQEMGQQINNHQSLIEQSSSNRAKKMMSQSGSDMVVKSPNMLFNPCGDKGMDGWISPYHHVDQTPSTQGGSRYTTNLSKASSTSSSFFTSGQHHKDNKIPKRLLGQHTSSSANPLGQWTVEHPQTPSSSSSSPLLLPPPR